MEITSLKQNNLSEAIDLATLCFGEEYREYAREEFGATFKTSFYSPKTFVARIDGRIIGLIQSLPNCIHVNIRSFIWLSTHPDFRRQGIAAKLLEHAENDAIETYFEGKDGTFLIIAISHLDYYKSLGYQGDQKTHDGHPIMTKYYRISR